MGSREEIRTSNDGVLRKVQTIFEEDELLDEKSDKENIVRKMSIEISTGKMFDADDRSRLNLVTALQEAIALHIVDGVPLASLTQNWKLKDNSIVAITFDELREANLVAVQTYGSLVKVQ